MEYFYQFRHWFSLKSAFFIFQLVYKIFIINIFLHHPWVLPSVLPSVVVVGGFVVVVVVVVDPWHCESLNKVFTGCWTSLSSVYKIKIVAFTGLDRYINSGGRTSHVNNQLCNLRKLRCTSTIMLTRERFIIFHIHNYRLEIRPFFAYLALALANWINLHLKPSTPDSGAVQSYRVLITE